MNAVIQSQLDRVETALNALIDSITSYNPSIPAVNELLQADDALSEGLIQLSAHQANYAHILSLQATTTALDAHLTSTLSTLARTRADILAAPATTFTPSQRPIPHPDLLEYAKTLSRHAAPPGLREAAAAAAAAAASAPLAAAPTTMREGEPGAAQTSTQDPAPHPATQPPHSVANAFHPAPGPSAAAPSIGIGIGIAALTTPEKQWLDPLLHAPYLPWPSEAQFRASALVTLQAKMEAGEDMEAGTVGEDMAVDARVNGESHGGEAERARTGAGVVSRREGERKPSVFAGLDLYDPEEE